MIHLNQTSFTELNSLFETVLDRLIPGYPLFSRFLETIGLDASWIVRFCVVPLVTIAGVHFLYQSFSYQLFSFFTSSVRFQGRRRWR
jgi:hypothetical protein